MRQKLRKRQGFRVDPTRTVDQEVFSSERRSHYQGDVFHAEKNESIPTCAQGHVIHGPQEIGGYCADCGRLLCTAPGCNVTCSICHVCVCQLHRGKVNGSPVCKSHGFFRLLFFSIFPDL
jgi:hypothetical protein